MRPVPAPSRPAAAALPQRNRTLGGASTLGLGAASLAAIYLYAWLFLDPLARYYSSAPPFVLADDYFKPHLYRAGGLVEYAWAFLAQLDYHPWLGAATFVLLLVLVSALARLVLHSIPASFPAAWLLPGVFLLAFYNYYLPSVLAIALELFLALGTLALWLAVRPGWLKLVLFPLLGAALFWLAGPAAPLVLISTGGLIELIRREKPRSAAACWFWFLPWSYGVAQFGGWAASGIVDRLGNRFLLATGVAIYSCLPLLCFAAFLRERLGLRASSAAPLRDGVGTQGMPWWRGRSAIIARSAFALAAVLALMVSFSPEKRTLLRIQSEAERGNWAGVLRAAAPLRETPIPARLQIQRALYHLHRLNDDLFSFPQSAGSDVFASLSDGLNVCVPMADTLLELGHVNLAEHYAHEQLEIRGERPEQLWRLAWINLIKERPRAGRVFLNRLKKVPFHRAQAERWLQSIERDPSMAGEREITDARLRRAISDDFEVFFSTEALLRALIRPDRPNPMANEFLLAHFLLTRQIEQLARAWVSFQPAADHRVPRHVSEALAAFSAGQRGPSQHAGKIDPEVSRAFEQFRLRLNQDAGRPDRGQLDLARDFGNTYWFYDVFGRSASTSR